MIKFIRTPDKPLTKAQEKVFYEKDNGLVCHTIDGPVTFEEIVEAVGNYYSQHPEDLIGWDLTTKLYLESGIANVQEVLHNCDEYKHLEYEVALALIRLVKVGLIKIVESEDELVEGVPI